jgi:hypothetical protein
MWEHQIVHRVLSTQLLVGIDLSDMADCCSAALGFDGVTHGDSDGEPIGSANSGMMVQMNTGAETPCFFGLLQPLFSINIGQSIKVLKATQSVNLSTCGLIS